MHKGPIEKRIALADESDIAAREKMRRDGGFRRPRRSRAMS